MEIQNCTCCPAGGGITYCSKKQFYIGDFLESQNTDDWTELAYRDIIRLWKNCGADKSLQQIEQESGYEEWTYAKIRNGLWEVYKNGEVFSQHSMESGATSMINAKDLRLKDPNARALFEFIQSILYPQ